MNKTYTQINKPKPNVWMNKINTQINIMYAWIQLNVCMSQ